MPASYSWFNIGTVIFSSLIISWYENKLRIWAHITKACRRANNGDIGLNSPFWFDRMSPKRRQGYLKVKSIVCAVTHGLRRVNRDACLKEDYKLNAKLNG
ncbi:hypothetical protein W01_17660 [Candidatus Nitrotoga sp. AM1P]|nr:hypothetical protein W01_17660 [Candidatus Nitrotoga sp. AM1P]